MSYKILQNLKYLYNLHRVVPEVWLTESAQFSWSLVTHTPELPIRDDFKASRFVAQFFPTWCQFFSDLLRTFLAIFSQHLPPKEFHFLINILWSFIDIVILLLIDCIWHLIHPWSFLSDGSRVPSSEDWNGRASKLQGESFAGFFLDFLWHYQTTLLSRLEHDPIFLTWRC